MIPVRTSLLRGSILVKSLVFFSSLIHPRFTSIFQSSLLSIFLAHILTSRVYFIRVYCLFFGPTSSSCESILAQSLVYFSSLPPRFASLFQSSLLSNFQAFILASRVYFSQVSCPRIASLFQSSRTKPDPGRQRQSQISPISKLPLVE